MVEMKPSDPLIADIDRTGDDLLARIQELASNRQLSEADGNGWIFLLLACEREIRKLRVLRIRELAICYAPDDIKQEILDAFPIQK